VGLRGFFLSLRWFAMDGYRNMDWVADASSLEPDYFQLIDCQQRGIPIGRPAEVNLRNTHAQYIFTW
jgi:cytochrome oxidase assembly protein ShyY1